MKKVLTIKNMNCAGCAKKITDAIAIVISDFKIDLSSKTIQFSGNEHQIKQVIEIIKNIGYDVE